MFQQSSAFVRYFRQALVVCIIASVVGCQSTPNAPTATVPPTAVITPSPEVQTLTFGFEDRINPPYVLTENEINWEKPGISLEVLKLVENRLKIKINYVRLPWTRCLDELKVNNLDGVFHASFKPERLENGAYPTKNGEVDPTRRMMANAYYLYKLKDSPLTWDGKTFSNLEGQMGAVLGFSVVADLRALGIEVDEVSDQSLGLQMLVKGRLAGWADLNTTTDLYLVAHPDEFGDIVRVEPPLSNKDYYLMLSHQLMTEQPELGEAIWDEIRHIHEVGEYAEIAQKYALPQP